MAGKFQGKVAIITGSSRGIGKAIAIELAKNGASIVLNGRNEQRLQETAIALARGVDQGGFIHGHRNADHVAHIHTHVGQAQTVALGANAGLLPGGHIAVGRQAQGHRGALGLGRAHGERRPGLARLGLIGGARCARNGSASRHIPGAAPLRQPRLFARGQMAVAIKLARCVRTGRFLVCPSIIIRERHEWHLSQ